MSVLSLVFSSQKSRLVTAVGAAPLVAAKVQLYTNDILPTLNSVIGDFTEATFGGYTAGGNAVGWGTVGINSNGVPVCPSDQDFIADGTGPTETAFGALLVDSTGALVAAGRFDEPRTFVNNGDNCPFILLFGLTLGSLTLATGP